MDGLAINDDEVISDSEEEEIGGALSIPNTNADKLLEEITQDSDLDPNRVKLSSISTSDHVTTSATKSRPNPRSSHKDNPDPVSSSHISRPSNTTSSSDIYLDTVFSATNIADRAKMRSRNTKSQAPISLPSSDIIELSSDDDYDFSLHASKPRRKPTEKPKPKAKAKMKVSPNITSVSHELGTDNPKPRPRPRPLVKSKPKKSSEPDSPLSGARSQENNFVPTSSESIPNEMPIPFNFLSTPLPPSDPPTSTSATYDHPPIETLPQIHTDHDLPSSPSSLFSVYSSGKKKRKRGLSNVDELQSDDDTGVGLSRMDSDARRMPPPPIPCPPPTFFVGSSSYPSDSILHPAPNVLPDTEPSVRKPSMPKKPARKKKVLETDEEDGAWGTNKPKAKSKPKKAPTRKVMEVVIEGSAKGKGKSANGKEKDKNAYKSREFIDDQEEDEINLIRADVGLVKNATVSEESSLSSVPDSEHEDLNPGPSKKRKSVEDDNTHARDEDDSELQKRGKTMGKRRMVHSDDEDDVCHSPVQILHKPSKGKQKGNSKAVKVTPKPATLFDGDDEQTVDPIMASEEESSRFSKENLQPTNESVSGTPVPRPASKPSEAPSSSISSRYTIAPKTKPTPMSDLIRRVNSKPGSPFCSPVPRALSSAACPATPGTAYSPYLKSSRSALSRIAPLHPNRRTPPPPLPPPPPKKKTKKELEREEQWEEELIESVGGITEWACMSDAERKEMRRAKREHEMSGWED
ncbi:hypothetical protein H0H81_006938 [Sphagnurus paluster]|uniref:Uncharacterized protein n=1 Tax=Sphagnurus paluster TaxID=117069 RepID=A0A9P7GKU5_9AGAR|nr:hypothetical protein H0H81_006938 [Sphagnurus paluster]